MVKAFVSIFLNNHDRLKPTRNFPEGLSQDCTGNDACCSEGYTYRSKSCTDLRGGRARDREYFNGMEV